MPYYLYKVSLFCKCVMYLTSFDGFTHSLMIVRLILLMIDGLNFVLSNDRAAPTDTNPKIPN